MPNDLFRSAINNAYKYLEGKDKNAPEDLTLKELIELMVNKERDNSDISNEQMAMNVYATCVATLIDKSYAFRYRIIDGTISIGINDGKGGEFYL